MGQPPSFLVEASRTIEEGTVRPNLPGRRGELIAWLSALGVGVGTAILALRLGELPTLGLGLTLFLILVATLISFGGWMERNTSIRIGERGVSYRSPVRRVEFAWDEIERLHATPIGDGWRIGVQGKRTRFSFRTASTLRFGSFREMPFGFDEGERVAGLIRARSRLSAPRPVDGGWVCDGDRSAGTD